MSRQKQGIRLPYALEKELGLELRNATSGKRRNGSVDGRKEQRKADRVEKKAVRGGRGLRGLPRGRGGRNPPTYPAFIRDDEASDGEESKPAPAPPNTATTENLPVQTARKSILRKPAKRQRSPSVSDSESSSPRSSSPGLVLDASSKAFKDRSAEEDAEIVALEKRLGLKTKKLPKSFGEDGLGDLLDGLEEEDEGRKRKREGRDWLERKRRKADDTGSADEEDEDEDDDIDIDGFDDSEDDEEENSEEGEDEDAFDGFDSDQPPSSQGRQNTKTRENPYVAPITSNTPAAKYVPPSLRKLQDSDSHSLERLKRQIQGHLNKLSEANLISILGEVEKIYQSNARQDVTSVLIDLLLSLFCNRSALQNTFVILHAAFVTAVYKVIGTDFGAEMLAKLIERFDQYHVDTETGKEGSNLISLLANLFIFGLVSSPIVFDHIRILLEDLNETNTELVLRVVRDCGPQLRQDDPTALKSIVQMMQSSAKRIADAGGRLSVRTQFMMETIIDLKNNKMKEATNNAGATREHFTRMRKVLGSLNSRNLRASEPLRISLDDIKNSDHKGKWWLVGASWKGNEVSSSSASSLTQTQGKESQSTTAVNHDPSDSEPDLPALARHYRMNTQIRRSIFIAIMSASNYQDAHIRIAKLRLKRSQEPEIAHVLLRCAGSETTYNPYYTVLAKRLCTSMENTKRMRKTFEFALWGLFRRLGENNHDDDDDDGGNNDDGEDAVEVQEIANLAKLYASLVTAGIISLSALKVLDLAYLKEKALMFVEYLLVTIMVESGGSGDGQQKNGSEVGAVVERVFERAADEAPQMVSRLMLFIKTHVRESDLVGGHKDRRRVKIGCQVALKTLNRKLRAEGGS